LASPARDVALEHQIVRRLCGRRRGGITARGRRRQHGDPRDRGERSERLRADVRTAWVSLDGAGDADVPASSPWAV
jgi:hypothetical protein